MGTIEVREAHRFDESALTEYLAAHLLGFEGPVSVTQFAGGQSNPTFLLSTGAGALVLRKKPPGKLLPSAHAVEREFRVLAALADSEVPVPTVRHLCEDATVIGTPFYVMDYLEGRIFSDPTLPGVGVDERAAMYDSMNATLAALHDVDWRAVGLEDYGKPEAYVARQIKRWSAQYEATATETIEAMDKLMTWLPANIPPGDETSIAHGDYRPGNLMYHPTEPKVIAVLDWELSTLGHPLGDLAYNCMVYRLPPTKAELSGVLGIDTAAIGIPSEADYLARYAERSGRGPIENFNFYVAFAFFRLAAICQGVYKRSILGNASDSKAGMYGAIAQQLAALAWSNAEL